MLANYLTQLFGGQASAPRGDTRRGTLAPGLQEAQRSSISDFNTNRQAANDRGIQASTNTGSVLTTDEGEIRITSVVETNSLLIQASQGQYSSIQAAIERIDQEPLQVLIESQILDVELNEDLQFGVNWFLSNNPDFVPPGDGGPISSDFDTAIFGGSTNLFATIAGPIGSGFIRATISALDSVTDVSKMDAGFDHSDTDFHAFMTDVCQSFYCDSGFPDEEHLAGVTMKPVLDDGDINIYGVTFL